MGCTAVVKDGKVDIWTSSTQTRGLARRGGRRRVCRWKTSRCIACSWAAASAGAGAQDFVRQGVAIAKAMEGTPVKMLDEEDTQHDFYRPASRYPREGPRRFWGNPVAWYSRVAATLKSACRSSRRFRRPRVSTRSRWLR